MTLAGHYTDFWILTERALDYALASVPDVDRSLKPALLDSYFKLDAFPDARTALKALKAKGHKTGILSNGSPAMDELIGRLVANVGVERSTAEKAVGIILDFLRKEGPTDKVQALIDRLPGAEALVAQQSEAGGFMGGIMGAGTKMMAAGLSMGQVQGVTRETIAYAREKIGDDAVGEIVGSIPGLSQFV